MRPSKGVPELDVSDLVRYPLPGMDVPSHVAFSRDGSAISYLRSASATHVLSLWRQDLDGEPRLLINGRTRGTARASLGDELWAQRTRARSTGVTAYRRASRADEVVAVMRGLCFVSNGVAPGVAMEVVTSRSWGRAVTSRVSRSWAFRYDKDLRVCANHERLAVR